MPQGKHIEVTEALNPSLLPCTPQAIIIIVAMHGSIDGIDDTYMNCPPKTFYLHTRGTWLRAHVNTAYFTYTRYSTILCRLLGDPSQKRCVAAITPKACKSKRQRHPTFPSFLRA